MKARRRCQLRFAVTDRVAAVFLSVNPSNDLNEAKRLNDLNDLNAPNRFSFALALLWCTDGAMLIS
jgi:hypothetical protein